MECKDILNLIAIIVIPIAAVLIGQWLQSRSEKRKDKMQIFKILMTSRIYGWTQDSVHCMNIIDIVFADDKTVCEAWKDLHDKYCVQNPDETQLRKIQNAQYKLLETMAKSLGYKDKVTWETIQNPYVPDGMIRQWQEQAKSQQAYNTLLNTMVNIVPKEHENTGNLLSYISELEKDVNGKKYGLVFEEHREEIDEILDTHTPVLTEDKDFFIDNGGQMNFLIEGDNLASLHLLEKTHKGNIDLIYIDPPYNTLKDGFTYSDTLVDKNDTFRHSKWLSFMKQRMTIAHKLLCKNGAVFISLDDNEVATLRILCDEILVIKTSLQM